MRFVYGDTTSLVGKDWYPVELRSEASVEVYLRRMIRTIPGVFRTEPVEIYIPLKNRDLDEFELLEGPFIYARSNYFIGLVRLKKVWGVVGLETRGDSRILKDAIKIEDEYVQRLQQMEVESAFKRVCGLRVGAGVRVLDGKYRDFCGQVMVIQEGGPGVKVLLNLGFRRIELDTFFYNVRVIEHDGSDICWVPDLLSEPEAGVEAVDG